MNDYEIANLLDKINDLNKSNKSIDEKLDNIKYILSLLLIGILLLFFFLPSK